MSLPTNLEMNMNRNFAIAAILAAAAVGNAFAGEITVDDNAFVSGRSRAEVQAELAQYQQARVNPWSIAYDPLRGFQSTRTRAEVVGEYLASRHAVTAMTAEDSGSAYLARGRAIPAVDTLAGEPQQAL